MNNNKVLIIVGMHRSGTSLTAQWISQCGVHLGDNLLGSSPGNKFGHVEDVDFLEFHTDLLAYWNEGYDVIEPMSAAVPQQYVQRARVLLAKKNADHREWGWKEPRTSLFLPLWDELIDQPKYLIVYRTYAEVVDSLMRRESKTINRRRNIFARYYRAHLHKKNTTVKANHYLKVWLAYNRAILEFVNTKHPVKNYILIKHDELQTSSDLVLDCVTNYWKFTVERVNMQEIFKEGHMKQGAKGIYDFNPELVRQAKQVMAELEKCSNSVSMTLNFNGLG